MKKIRNLIAPYLIAVSTITIMTSYAQDKKQSSTSVIYKVKDNGKVIVENGKGEKVSINYECTNCSQEIKDTSLFNMIVSEATIKAKNALKFPLSFVPKRINLIVSKEDSLYYFENNKKIENVKLVIIHYYFIGKNAFGVEIEDDFLCELYVKDNKIVDLKNEIKLDSLKFDKKGTINRMLELHSSNDDNYILIRPTRDKGLIVLSSLDCVDKGTSLIIHFENNEKIILKSWNDFNCKGTSYFDLNSNNIENLKENRIKYIFIGDGKKKYIV